jgi:steroid delta-isomerase-like uncharacterized protein
LSRDPSPALQLEDLMTTSVREAFERGTAAFNAHDIDGFAQVLSEDVLFEAPGIRGRGKAECIDFFGGWFGPFPDGHVTVHTLHILDEVVIEEGTFKGTHTGVLHVATGDLPATGRRIELPYIQVLRFRDGQHVSFNLMFDRLALLEQLGAVPV